MVKSREKRVYSVFYLLSFYGYTVPQSQGIVMQGSTEFPAGSQNKHVGRAGLGQLYEKISQVWAVQVND